MAIGPESMGGVLADMQPMINNIDAAQGSEQPMTAPREYGDDATVCAPRKRAFSIDGCLGPGEFSPVLTAHPARPKLHPKGKRRP